MEEIYEFVSSSSVVYSVDDHMQPPYFGSPPAFCDELLPMGFGSRNMSSGCSESSAANSVLVDKSGTSSTATRRSNRLTGDSELDDFMGTYCDVLTKFKSDLERPFNETTDAVEDKVNCSSSLGRGQELKAAAVDLIGIMTKAAVDNGGYAVASLNGVYGLAQCWNSELVAKRGKCLIYPGLRE